ILSIGWMCTSATVGGTVPSWPISARQRRLAAMIFVLFMPGSSAGLQASRELILAPQTREALKKSRPLMSSRKSQSIPLVCRNFAQVDPAERIIALDAIGITE